MQAAALWQRGRKRGPHRKRRTVKAHFGELLQLDGSHHPWLEERAEKACPMNLFDDATGRGMFGFADEETTWAGTRVRVEQWRDGSLHVAHEGRGIRFTEIAQPEPKAKPAPAAKRPAVRVKPQANHPWKRSPAVAKRGVNS